LKGQTFLLKQQKVIAPGFFHSLFFITEPKQVQLKDISQVKCVVLDIREEEIRLLPICFKAILDISTVSRILFNRARNYALVFLDSSTKFPKINKLIIEGKKYKVIFPNCEFPTIPNCASPKRESIHPVVFYLKPRSVLSLEVPEQEKLREKIQRDFKEIYDWKVGEFSNKIRIKFRNPEIAAEFAKTRKIVAGDIDVKFSDPFVRFFLDRVPDFINSEKAKNKTLFRAF
jgi:hypothetical protein